MRIFVLVAGLALAACQPATTAPMTSLQIPPAEMAVPANSFLSLINAERAEQGRTPLNENAALSRASRDHARDMVNNGYFSHQGRNGSSFSDRARAAGYTCAAAENIASGQETASQVINGWMNSPGHRRKILLVDATEFGIGQVGTMWVLMLGRGC